MEKARYYVLKTIDRFIVMDRVLGHGIAETTEHKFAGRIVSCLNKQLLDSKLNKKNNQKAEALKRKEEELKSREHKVYREELKVDNFNELKEKAANWDKLYGFLDENEMIPHYWD